MPVILGSGSARRLELLRSIGVEPDVVCPNVDERVHAGEQASDYVRRLASRKLDETMKLIGAVGVGTIVIAADTTVELEGHILGKPATAAEAIAMLTGLSGHEHCVHTGFAVAVSLPGCRGVEWEGHVEVVTSRVWFRELSSAEIVDYVASGEPADKAGAYAIQGAARAFVDRIEGSVQAIIGLPLERLIEICAGLGSPLPQSR